MKDIFGQEYQYDSEKGFSNLSYGNESPWDSSKEPPKDSEDAPESSDYDQPEPICDVSQPKSESKPQPQPKTPDQRTKSSETSPNPNNVESKPALHPSFGDIYKRFHQNDQYSQARPKPENVPPAHIPENLTQISSLDELRDALENPLDDGRSLQDAIDAFSSYGNYYMALQSSGVERKVSGYYDTDARRRFEEDMFARWRKNIEDLTPEEIQQQIANGKGYYQNYASIQKLLEHYKDRDIRTRGDLDRNLRQDFQGQPDKLDQWLDLLDRYGFVLDDNWEHIKSRYVNLRKEERIDVKHRFYLNIDSTAVDEVARELVGAYEDAKLPYYFKFDSYGARRDTMVIYTSDESAVDNLKIIQDLIRRRPDLAEHLREAPVLTGKIDGIIGYGPEPATTKDANGNEQNHSYSEIRANILQSAINEVSEAWFKEHWDDEYEIDGAKMSMREHCDYAMLDHIVEMRMRTHHRLSEKKTPDEVYQFCGFKPDEILPGGKYFHELESGIKAHRKGMSGERFEVALDGRNKIYVSEGDYRNARHALVKKISRIDSDFNIKVRAKVDEIARQNGVDPAKFCFDLPAAA